MAREQAPAIGGAEATLKRIDYIEDEAENIQFAIWANRPISAKKMLKTLSQEVDEAEGQIMDLYRALSSLERSLEELEQMSEGDRSAWDLTMLGLQHLREGNWGAAADCVEGAVASMGRDGLERSLNTLGRHLNEMGELSDIEEIALTLVNQGKKALDSDLSSSAKAFEDAISALGPVTVHEATSPFLVNGFFLSIGTTWPEGKDHALMVITLENTGENNISTMRLAPPIPYGWTATPKMCEIPEIPPEGFIEIGIEIRPSGSFPPTALLGSSLEHRHRISCGLRFPEGPDKSRKQDSEHHAGTTTRPVDARRIRDPQTSSSRKLRTRGSNPRAHRGTEPKRSGRNRQLTFCFLNVNNNLIFH